MDHEEMERQLLQAGRFPRPFEWLFQRGQLYEAAFVNDPRLARRMVWWTLVKMLLMIGAGFLVGFDGWARLTGVAVLVVLAAFGATSQLRRAQAYRSGWVDRGKRMLVLHATICRDPVANDAFHRAVVAESIDALL